jgi:hypothetical protein
VIMSRAELVRTEKVVVINIAIETVSDDLFKEFTAAFKKGYRSVTAETMSS